MPAELTLTAEDLSLVRFAPSPMWEVVTSFRLLQHPGVRHPVHGVWLDQVRPRLAAAGLLNGRIAALIPPDGSLPDFLNPVPADSGPTLDTELAAIAATPVEQIAADLDIVEQRQGRPLGAFATRLRRHPEAALDDLAQEVRQYFDTALAPYWARIRTVLDAEVFHRARQVAEHGVVRVFNDIHPDLSWDGGTIRMLHRQRVLCTDDSAPGLILVPSAFAGGRVLTRAWPGDVPQLCYGARGVGTVFERRSATPSDSIAAVLGRSRALLLAELAAPASTTELATRTGMSAGGISEHLTALRGAGMVSAHRSGRSVLYARTAIADSLLAAAG